MCETFNRRAAAVAAGPPEEIPEREALEKPVGANLFYFEYKVGDEIFSPFPFPPPRRGEKCVVDERTDRSSCVRARGRIF